MNKIIKKNNLGFTLIELLVVITIIGIISIIVLNLVSGSKDRANSTVTKRNLSSLRSGISLCCTNPSSVLQTTPGSDMCNPAIGFTLMTFSNLRASNSGSNYSATSCSVPDPYYTITLSGHPKSQCIGVWYVYSNKVIAPSGC